MQHVQTLTTEETLDLSLPADVPVLADDAQAIAAAVTYAALIRPGAIARDRDSSLPHEELRELARTGLLGARDPASHGGAQISNATVAEVFRIISAADPAIGQIPQNHFAFAETPIRFGSQRQKDLLLPQFLAGARLGNALSERGGANSTAFITRLVAQENRTYLLNGRKYYTTGALTAQLIPVFALDDTERVSVAYVPRDAAGVHVDQDWNAFGQRATFSGTATFTDVRVEADWVIENALQPGYPNTFAAFGQLMHVAVDVGIARGALDDGVAFLREHARAWFESPTARAADDPALAVRVGELEVTVRAAETLLAEAARALDRADLSNGPAEITEARLAVAAAKAFAGQAALTVATGIFDLAGSSAADRTWGLDRHWRNARTHTLHDPARSKLLHLGRYVIDAVAPPAEHPLI